MSVFQTRAQRFTFFSTQQNGEGVSASIDYMLYGSATFSESSQLECHLE